MLLPFTKRTLNSSFTKLIGTCGNVGTHVGIRWIFPLFVMTTP